MDNSKKPQKPNEKDPGKKMLGKRHEDSDQKPDANERNNLNKKNMAGVPDDDRSNPEKNIEISDNPEETERKIPRMKH